MNVIRIVNKADAKAILAIYAPYILHTSYTFETEIPSAEDFAQRINTYIETWPWLVCETDGVLTGYAYATRHRERVAYQWCVESSVYIHERFHGQGIGVALYRALFKILKHQGFRNVYAGITLPNNKSVTFHEKLGFTWFADYENIGYKHGKWNTVSWWLKQINEYSAEPLAPVKFKAIPSSQLQSILEDQSF
ncbi:MAG: N-acetyltransferase family protein [Bacteroidota bacterium]|nr:N-acetyltransferase family protein [Bacteroidota bacterium]